MFRSNIEIRKKEKDSSHPSAFDLVKFPSGSYTSYLFCCYSKITHTGNNKVLTRPP